MSIEQALTKTVGLNAQSFIEKAIEGGWGKDAFYRGEVTHCKTENGKIYLEWFSGETESLHLHEEAKERILLDPLAWKAVGKVEGWTEWNGIDSPYENEVCWYGRMHGLIDALAEGKIM